MTQIIPKFTIKPGYRPQSQDTTPEVDCLEFWLLKQRTPEQRLIMGSSINQNARRFSISCFRQRFSYLSKEQFSRKLAEAWLAEDCPHHYIPTGNEMSWVQDSITLAEILHPILESLNIPYYITGGVAAIAYGEVRTTRDLDIVISISSQDLTLLILQLEAIGFYVSGVDDVVSGRMRILQVTHIETISRADLIMAENSEFEQIKFERRQQYKIPTGATVFLASAEDVILNKLYWRKSNQSEKQWRDVLGVLKVQGQCLDLAYLKLRAESLGLVEDLDQALIEAGF
ncbi:hypothetical protein [Planktothrix agardhii]|jgi:hypothetical protein|uniref:Uncharacterized protein n=1 Tax=Planktothrix agardhii TaxID=1160 RepID=A0AAD1PWH6_PLAAG|nr:hypothetical protein [Planktothrix agardhii]MCF3605848.1 hypothetical protein [Planktothrix agardhii 1033]MCB8749881.1 hypothetical protein [Planktothrix agardhii 1810]MCB8758626.1 hypothetical protein [Planktothrix agardhii 1813]MCB8765635.1 hypothetical protein [Planktothrix agardhii 1809]MCB8779267.1 hypothetical protein [Planktothrix agardhii 1031]